MSKYWLIIPAAGIGKRMGAELPKQYLTIAGRSIIDLTLERLSQLECIEKIVVALHPKDQYWQHCFHQDNSHQNNRVMTVIGGEQRFDSVVRGMEALGSVADKQDWVLIHDAVRPCVSLADIEKLIAALADDDVGGILAAPVRETLKKTFANHKSERIIENTPDREHYWLAATPQMFRYGLLLESMKKVIRELTLDNSISMQMTDEAAVMSAAGHQVKIISGRSDNIKVTHPEDLALVEFILNHSA